MHRAHEELCKMALERLSADGVLIHMTLGKLKEGDIPGDIRDAAIRKMVEIYFPNNTAIISGFGFDMLYAGPRKLFFMQHSDKIAVAHTLLLAVITLE